MLLAGLKREPQFLFAVDGAQKAEQDDEKLGENEPWAGRRRAIISGVLIINQPVGIEITGFTFKLGPNRGHQSRLSERKPMSLAGNGRQSSSLNF